MSENSRGGRKSKTNYQNKLMKDDNDKGLKSRPMLSTFVHFAVRVTWHGSLTIDTGPP